jgi:hypothetical protein
VIVYLVSGDADIIPTDVVLRRTGRRVRHGVEVNGDARRQLRSGRRYVVVAHGNKRGTVKWFRSDWDTPQRWLYVGMTHPPSATRIYLYSCFVGKRLPRYLRKRGVEAFGHIDRVPVPNGSAKRVVLSFLDVVDDLVSGRHFDHDHWQQTLADFVNTGYAAEVLYPTGLLNAATWAMLRRSLEHPDA